MSDKQPLFTSSLTLFSGPENAGMPHVVSRVSDGFLVTTYAAINAAIEKMPHVVHNPSTTALALGSIKLALDLINLARRNTTPAPASSTALLYTALKTPAQNKASVPSPAVTMPAKQAAPVSASELGKLSLFKKVAKPDTEQSFVPRKAVV